MGAAPYRKGQVLHSVFAAANSIKKDSTSEIARLTAEIQEIKKILAIRNLEICVAHTQISELKIETERLTRKSNNDRAQYLRSSKKPA